MKREKLIAEIADAIEAKLGELSEAGASLWDCYIPEGASEQMARAAVAILEAYETSEQFVRTQTPA